MSTQAVGAATLAPRLQRLDALQPMSYQAPLWLPGGHLQTLWGARLARQRFGPPPAYQRERWDTPDGDFIDVDFLPSSVATPALTARLPQEQVRPHVQTQAKAGSQSTGTQHWLVLFHGLEGSSTSHYSVAFADHARANGMHFAVPHFRGCSGELNRAPRAYHSGDHAEIAWVLKRMRERIDAQGGGSLVAVGISLGGNALLRWAQEAGEDAGRMVNAVAAVCSPIDLAAGGHAMGRGFNRQVYTRMFLRSMKPRALRQLQKHPGLFDARAMHQVQDLYAFDQIYTAPLHGFSSTEDYWARSSAKPHLHRIRVPALVLNAMNDPFVPTWSLPSQRDVGDWVRLWQPAHGGHAGFPQGSLPGHIRQLPDMVVPWLRAPR